MEKKKWSEFRDTGLFLFINSFLHIFGWALVAEADGNDVLTVYPARVKHKGFPEDSYKSAYEKLAKYMIDHSSELSSDTCEEQMDIFSKKGTKVTVTERSIKNGSLLDREVAKDHLKVGEMYTVSHTDVHPFETQVYIEEIPDVVFNSVNFVASPLKSKMKNFILRVEQMIKNEENHLEFLISSKGPEELINISKKHLEQYRKRLNEYKTYIDEH